MIKIEPLFATDYAQTKALLRYQPDYVPAESRCSTSAFFFRGLAFWQHWLPCRMHLVPSVYVAKEDGVILGLITVSSTGKSKNCWQVDHLIVHPDHRGRGIAQELLRYVFALFGSQGVSHFIAEVSDQNSAALTLFGSCGFRRCAKVAHYHLRIAPEDLAQPMLHTGFRLATELDKQALLQLHQEALPPDIRLIFSLSADDFAVSQLPVEKAQRLRETVAKKKVWYWLSEDTDRKVITSAVKVVAHGPGDYHLEFAVHPGWSELANDLVAFCINWLRLESKTAFLFARAYDYQLRLGEILEANGMERTGGFCLLAREHWLRAKHPKKLKIDKTVSLPGVSSPAINFPLATERNILN
ncbi:MAG: GNAT family N-acetyltransferase [Candidatus Melainabacteria bacterium]|nr:GNAT family N-acetyltransferase [Candidatus Melainabacteria bacterium]